jgi:hypothetical protein
MGNARAPMPPPPSASPVTEEKLVLLRAVLGWMWRSPKNWEAWWCATLFAVARRLPIGALPFPSVARLFLFLFVEREKKSIYYLFNQS